MNDSSLVVGFLARFTKLTESAEDSDQLLARAKSDPSVGELCLGISIYAAQLVKAERSRRELFSASTNPSFVRAWRRYQKEYEHAVEKIALSQILPDIDLPIQLSLGQKRENWSKEWNHADNVALVNAQIIDDMLGRGLDWLRNTEAAWPFEDFGEDDYEQSVENWDTVFGTEGHDLRGILRRRQLVPFLLVPRDAANKLTPGDPVGLLAMLQDAQESFVFGQFRSSISMLRATVEKALKSLYGAKKEHLKECISEVASSLPDEGMAAALHRFREFAGSVIHAGKSRAIRLLRQEPRSLEIELLSDFRVVQRLIEGGVYEPHEDDAENLQ